MCAALIFLSVCVLFIPHYVVTRLVENAKETP
jgi:hypothetical protein